MEEFGAYRSISAIKNYEYFKIDLAFSSIPIMIYSFFDFITPPFLKGKISFFYFVQLIEVFTMTVYLYFRIKFQKNFNIYIFNKWFLTLILSYFTYSLIIFNDGTSLRYKVPIIFFIIFGYFANIKKKN